MLHCDTVTVIVSQRNINTVLLLCCAVVLLCLCVVENSFQVSSLDSQVMLVDEDKKAVEGQQANGAPCGTTQRAEHYCHSLACQR